MSSRRTGKSPRVSARSGWSLQHRPRTSRRRGARGGGGENYSTLSKGPLHSLIFLLPLIIAYEIGTRLYLNDPSMSSVQTIRAHSLLLAFFRDFGVAGRFLPAITVVAVLAVWHVINSDRTRIRPQVLPGMVLEGVLLTVPLIVFIGLMQLAFGTAAPSPAAAQMTQTLDPLAKLPWRAGLTISLGAGLYEEMLFRMVGVTVLHMICVDLARMSEKVGTGLAVALCAAAFAAYHDVMGPGGHVDVLKAVSLAVAGLYFGLVFSVRGFGLAVGVHVLYDVYVLVLSRPAS